MIRNLSVGANVFDEEKILNYQSLKLESLLQNVQLEKGRAEKNVVKDQAKTNTTVQLTEMMIRHALPKEEVKKKI